MREIFSLEKAHLTDANTSKISLFPGNSALTMLVRDGFDGQGLVLCVEVWWCVWLPTPPVGSRRPAGVSRTQPSPSPPSIPPGLYCSSALCLTKAPLDISVSQDHIDGRPYPDTL